MKKLLKIFFWVGIFSSMQTTAATELVKDTKVAQPINTKYPTHTLMISRYPLANDSTQAYSNLINSTLRDFGSGEDKTVNIIWTNTSSEKSAARIRDELVKKGILKHKIVLIRSHHKRPIYPIYVEVEKITAKKTKCRVNIGEDMMSYNVYDACATKNNYRIQMKY